MTQPTSLQSAAMAAQLGDVEQLMTQTMLHPGDAVLGPMAVEHLRTGGKRLRARLALASAEVLGVPPQAATVWAAACEMAHNATLIHDDLQDGDTLRRGQPTTWVRYGMAQAINAGDLLLMAPFTLIGGIALGYDIKAALHQAMAEHMITVIRGQALECALMNTTNITQASYDAIIRQKTSALFELPVFGAALAAGRTRAMAATLTAPFAPLGRLFQMQDDVLDLFGDKGREAPGADLREGKISALVVAHWHHCPQDRPRLEALLKSVRAQTPESEVTYFIERFSQAGTVQRVLQAIDTDAAQARKMVDPVLQTIMDALIDLVCEPIAQARSNVG